MKPTLNVSALFYKGKLFQIGDFVTTHVEYLDEGQGGFSHYSNNEVIKNIEVRVDSLCNSLYLNHGFTYQTVGGLSYAFEMLSKRKEYAFETQFVPFPTNARDQEKYLNEYYYNIVNSDKAADLMKKFNINKSNKIGSYLKEHQREIFDYIVLTFKIRQGKFGELNDQNFSDVTFRVLKDHGYTNTTVNPIYLISSGNSMYTAEDGKNYQSKYKSFV
jgi:hypothetical protein